MALIGLNTLFLVPNQVGGTEYLTRAFIDALQKDTTHQYVLFCNRENADTFQVDPTRMKKVVCPVSASNRIARIVYEQCIFPFVIQKERCDLLHSFGYTAPFFASCPQITTVHDTNWLDHPEDFSLLSRFMTNVLVRGAIKKSVKVITDSAFSKSRLLLHFPDHVKKVEIVLPIIDTKLYKSPFVVVPKELSGKKYFLCVSALYPHKKIPFLLKLWEEIEQQDTKIPLVLVGRNGRDEEGVTAKLKSLQSVVYFPKVSFEMLQSLYHHASGFIHPSVYEGFGYPVYEAYGASLPILVGKKNMYEQSIQANLEELTFDSKKDSTMVKRILERTKTKKPNHLWSDTDSLQNLLIVYAKALQ